MKYLVTHILSAFQNEMDWDKVEQYTQELIEEDIFHEFPPIEGFGTVIDETDFGECFISGEQNLIEVNQEHLGMKVWKVTNGHHRTVAFNRAFERTGLLCFKWIETKEDKSCFVG